MARKLPARPGPGEDAEPPGALLSPYVLAELVTRFGARPEVRVTTELRFPLAGCRATLRLTRGDGAGTEHPVELVDLSMRGVGFLSARAVPEGTQLQIRLDPGGLRTQSWTIRVQNVRMTSDGRYHVGARFERIEEPLLTPQRIGALDPETPESR